MTILINYAHAKVAEQAYKHAKKVLPAESFSFKAEDKQLSIDTEEHKNLFVSTFKPK
jgi:hypothetical protein